MNTQSAASADDRHLTGIGWTHMPGYVGRTWNPVFGCDPVSRGCLNCYAMTLTNMRHGLYVAHDGHWPKSGKPMPAQYAHPFSAVRPRPEVLHAPTHWQQPSFIFISMTDLFHEAVPDEYIQEVFAVMTATRCAHHIFQVLTKRADRLAALAPSLPWRGNVWIGVSVEDGHPDRLRRVEALRAVKAVAPYVITTVSAEPLLGSVAGLDLSAVDWLIAGWESGPGARPWPTKAQVSALTAARGWTRQQAQVWAAERRARAYADLMQWTREARDLAFRSQVPFFLKQFATHGGSQIKAPFLDGWQYLEWPEYDHTA